MKDYDFTPEDFNKISDIENDFETQDYTEDPRFGPIALLQHKEDPSLKLLSKEKFSTNLPDCERDIYQARDRIQLIHPCLLKMVDYSAKMLQNDEETEFLVSGYYEYPENDLKSEIANRAEQQNYFTENDLLRMIEDVLDCLAFLQEGKMVHGDVRPIYVEFVEEGRIRLLDRMGDPNPPNQVQVKNMKKKKNLYMSPTLFKCLAQRESKVRHNPYKSDVFSLGVVILEAGLLHSVQDIYDMENRDINIDLLLSHLDEFCTVYDNELIKEVICLLLDLEEKLRKDPRKMLKHFRVLLEEFRKQEGEGVEEVDLEEEKRVSIDGEEDGPPEEEVVEEENNVKEEEGLLFDEDIEGNGDNEEGNKSDNSSEVEEDREEEEGEEDDGFGVEEERPYMPLGDSDDEVVDVDGLREEVVDVDGLREEVVDVDGLVEEEMNEENLISEENLEDKEEEQNPEEEVEEENIQEDNQEEDNQEEESKSSSDEENKQEENVKEEDKQLDNEDVKQQDKEDVKEEDNEDVKQQDKEDVKQQDKEDVKQQDKEDVNEEEEKVVDDPKEENPQEQIKFTNLIPKAQPIETNQPAPIETTEQNTTPQQPAETKPEELQTFPEQQDREVKGNTGRGFQREEQTGVNNLVDKLQQKLNNVFTKAEQDVITTMLTEQKRKESTEQIQQEQQEVYQQEAVLNEPEIIRTRENINSPIPRPRNITSTISSTRIVSTPNPRSQGLNTHSLNRNTVVTRSPYQPRQVVSTRGIPQVRILSQNRTSNRVSHEPINPSLPRTTTNQRQTESIYISQPPTQVKQTESIYKRTETNYRRTDNTNQQSSIYSQLQREEVKRPSRQNSNDPQFISRQLLSKVEEPVSVSVVRKQVQLSKITEESARDRSTISHMGERRTYYSKPSTWVNVNRTQTVTSSTRPTSKRELYVAPQNYSEIRKDNRKISEDNREDNRQSNPITRSSLGNSNVNTYNYTCVIDKKANSRKYILRRGEGKSFGNLGVQRSGVNKEMPSVVLDDVELSRRYNGLELREERKGYQVYRVVGDEKREGLQNRPSFGYVETGQHGYSKYSR